MTDRGRVGDRTVGADRTVDMRAHLVSVPLSGADRTEIAQVVDLTGSSGRKKWSRSSSRSMDSPTKTGVSVLPAHEMFDLERLVEE